MALQPAEVLAREIVNAKMKDETLKHLEDAFYTCPSDDEESLKAIKDARYTRAVEVTREICQRHAYENKTS